jgi:hypothetical protein
MAAIAMGKRGKIRLMEVQIDFKLAINVGGILRGQGADPGAIRLRKPALVSVAERARSHGCLLSTQLY